MSSENVPTDENLQNTVKELVQQALSSEMQRFQEAAAAIKQTQSSPKAAEGIIAIIIIGIGSRVPNLRGCSSRSALPVDRDDRGCPVTGALVAAIPVVGGRGAG